MLRIYTFCLVVFILQIKSNSCTVNILVFGGNGFIGSECVSVLLSEGHNITLLIRGSNYYDYETRIKPHVTVITCDRYQGLHNCQGLNNKVFKFDVIIDFTAYRPLVVEDAVQFFNGQFGTYIYISTDSVYEISRNRNSKRAKEEDVKMSRSVDDYQRLSAVDEYGHMKLLGEEFLISESLKSDLKFVILRLADVIGPRDTTCRWWAYQTLLQFHSPGMPIYIPSNMQSLTTSYTYVKDIGKMMAIIVDDLTIGRGKSVNETYNFAFPTAMSLKRLLYSMQKALDIRNIEFQYESTTQYLFPSVKHGSIDVKKIKEVFQYETVPWMQAVRETVAFHKESYCNFPHERDKMLEKLRSVISKDDFFKVMENLREHISYCTSSSPISVKLKNLPDNHTMEQKRDEL